MLTNQTIDTATVSLFKFRSATPEDPRFDVMPPPNMSERPPPLPLCRRMKRVKAKLVKIKRTRRIIFIATKLGEPFVSAFREHG